MRAACIGAAAFFLLPAPRSLSQASAAQPIVTDSRIKTFVYNPNEVFAITTHYGYQSNIEFGEKETIDTVSVGDRVGWQIIPSGRRLFIRAMEENAHTNMTIVTNQRAYQFDLRSSASNVVFGSEELTYVVRFYYPDAHLRTSDVAIAADFTPQAATPIDSGYGSVPTAYVPQQATGYIDAPQSVHSSPPTVSMPPQISPSAAPPLVAAPTNTPAYNYRYTYSGASDIAPTKIYDDGVTTYFRLPPSASVPRVTILTVAGENIEVSPRQLPNNIIAVDAIAQQFSLSQPSGQVTVYNEAGGV